MNRFPTAPSAFVAAVLLAAAAPARADLIRLFDGKTVEGKATLGGNKWTVKGYKGKSTTYAASEVKFREAGDCSWEVSAKMVKEIPSDASDALFVEKHLEVARYLKDRRQYCPEMEELELKEYEAVLKKAPENEDARVGLGHVKWAQWWFRNEKDRDKKRKDAPASEMEPLGFVKYKKTGMWETKEDAEAMDAGKVKFKGKWMTEDEKKAAQGYVKDEKGGWVLARDVKDRERAQEVEKTLGEKPGTVVSSQDFRFISWLSVGETAQLKDTAEKAYAWTRDIFGYPMGTAENPGEDLFPEPIDVFLLVDGKRKDKWLDAFGSAYGMDASVIDFRKKGSGWHAMSPMPYFLSSGKPAEKNRQRDTEGDMNVAGSHVCSMVGRIVLDRIRPGNQIPPWLGEAAGLLTEIRFHETADCCYVTESKYREEVANKEGSRAKYFDFMKKQVAAGLDRSMLEIFSLELNNLDWADSVKAWCFLDFLWEKNPTEFRELVRHPLPEVDMVTPPQVAAAIKAHKPKDPAAAPIGKQKDEGEVPKEPVKVRGPGAVEITEGSPLERARNAAAAEQWLLETMKKDAATLEKEWKAWLLTK
jgi:hypothetical protein